jgi:hypothetical protein
MLVTSVLAAVAVFGCLMAVDWYVWDPRLRRSNDIMLHPEDRNGKMLRNAA